MAEGNKRPNPFVFQDDSDAGEEEMLANYLMLASPHVSERTFGGQTSPSQTSPSASGGQTSPSPLSPLSVSHGAKVYVVFHGRKIGILHSWNEVALSVNGYTEARHASYPTLADAQKAWNDAVGKGQVGTSSASHELKRLASPFHENIQPPSQSLRPPPYSNRQKTPIKKEEVTPRVPRTGSTGASPSPLAGGYPRPSFLAGGSSRYEREEDSWWVVTIGKNPGIYRGKTTARKHAGNTDGIDMRECRDGIEQARQLFVDLFAARLVRRLGRPPNSSYQPAYFVPASFVQNDNFWYVVPRGPHPGVYKGRRTAYRMSGPTAEHMLRCESERAAYAMFVELYMTQRVQEGY